MNDDLPITDLSEIVINVRDLPLMRVFRRNVFGFELLDEAHHDESTGQRIAVRLGGN